ncbi:MULTISPECIES: flagellar hook protein FlgE [Pseudomonas]|uniref:flagellar hook protein FlgE n=1 Tax=Pseudomonas TaxID=286 RepID=UPI000B4D2711|nr:MULTISPECIES: flagellar hook protein FlgE [Pseudomonas]AOA04995.1 flagellar hook protein FlgE [Pseudomonas sp. TMW 2.1634]ASC85292.1 flagellar hook protein FlgE [Pseudomonas fragi]PAA27269.1 flagellar hook protein FlgE [Pseudomonas fragi]
MSFNIALTGLNAVSQQLNTISNNIANSGTVGFKSSRTEFGSLYSGTQAMGVGVLGHTQSMSLGGSHFATGNNLNLAISESGFFVTRSPSGDINYTRAGAFGKDRDNFLVDASGQYLQGYPVDAAGNLQVGIVSDLRLQNGNLPAKATDRVDFVANLDASKAVVSVTPFDPANVNSYTSSQTTPVYDSQGKQHSLTQYFVKTADNTWETHYYVGNTAVGGPEGMTFDTSGQLSTPLAPVNISFTLPGVNAMSIDIDYTRSTQSASDFSVTTNNPNGYSAGENTGVTVEKDGKVYATYSNGERMLQGQVVLANFANPNGLKNENNTRWSATGESGIPLIGAPGTGLFGDLTAGALESSNVDMTQQLVGLMEGQRNYQANSKVLSTNKELTQVLFNSI